MTDLTNIPCGSQAWDAAMAAKGRAVREAYPDAAAEADFSRSARSGSEALMLQALAASQPHHAMTEAHTTGSEGVFASATSRTGSPINGSRVLREDDRVMWRGMQITVGSALGCGLLVRDAGGIIREPRGAGSSTARPTEGAGNAAPEQAPNESPEAPFRGTMPRKRP